MGENEDGSSDKTFNEKLEELESNFAGLYNYTGLGGTKSGGDDYGTKDDEIKKKMLKAARPINEYIPPIKLSSGIFPKESLLRHIKDYNIDSIRANERKGFANALGA